MFTTLGLTQVLSCLVRYGCDTIQIVSFKIRVVQNQKSSVFTMKILDHSFTGIHCGCCQPSRRHLLLVSSDLFKFMIYDALCMYIIFLCNRDGTALSLHFIFHKGQRKSPLRLMYCKAHIHVSIEVHCNLSKADPTKFYWLIITGMWIRKAEIVIYSWSDKKWYPLYTEFWIKHAPAETSCTV